MSDIFNMADTWNAGGTTFNAIKMNVTDTASAADSMLLLLQVGGASKAGIGKVGNFYNYNTGTAALPAYAFDITGNRGYGMWYSGGELKFSINGTEAASIASASIKVAGLVGATTPGVFYGFRRQNWPLTTTQTITSASYNYSTITNFGAAAGITITIPTAAVGWNITFIDDNASFRLTVKPNTADTIIWTDGTVVTNATGSIVATAQYNSFELEAMDATVWVAKNVRGTWTVTA